MFMIDPRADFNAHIDAPAEIEVEGEVSLDNDGTLIQLHHDNANAIKV